MTKIDQYNYNIETKGINGNEVSIVTDFSNTIMYTFRFY